MQSRVKLFRADGTELTYGWDGEFYKGFYGRENKNSGQMTLRVDSYDILDPEAVEWIEIDGERFEVECTRQSPSGHRRRSAPSPVRGGLLRGRSPKGEAKEKSTRMARTMRVLTFYVSISRTY